MRVRGLRSALLFFEDNEANQKDSAVTPKETQRSPKRVLMGGGVDFSLVFTLHNEVNLKFEGPESFFCIFFSLRLLLPSKKARRGREE